MPKRTIMLLPVLALAGCADGPVKPDPEVVAEARQRFLLEVEPADAMTALDWRDRQSAEESSEDSVELNPPPPAPADTLTLVGKIGGMPNPFGADLESDFPWRPGEATFFLVDPSTAAEFAEHAGEEGADHAEDCPFCAREAATKLPAVAVVTFSRDGRPVPIDARELFGIEEGDLVVVRGAPSQVGDLLTLEADGLYVRE